MQEHKNIQTVTGSTIGQSMMTYRDDTIDLVDILVILIKRKRIIFWSVFCSLAAGVFFLLSKPPLYSYVTAIEIGSQMTEDGTPVFFESAQTLKSKLESAYIPQVLQAFARAYPEDNNIKKLKISVNVPKQSELIIISAKGSEDQSKLLLDIEHRILDLITKDHGRILSVIRSSIVKEKAEAEAELAYLKNDKSFDVTKKELQSELVFAQTKYQQIKEPDFVKAKRKVLENKLKAAQNKLGLLIDQNKKLDTDAASLKKAEIRMSEKVAVIKKQIQQSLTKRDQALDDVSDPTQAMTLLMIDSEIQQTRQFLTELEQQLFIELAKQLSDIQVQAKDNQRKQEGTKAVISKIKLDIKNFDKKLELEGAPAHAEIDKIQAKLAGLQVDRERNIQQQIQKIQDLEVQIDNLSPTRSVSPPMQSLNPQGLGRLKTLIIFGLMGIAVGFVLVVVAELKDKARIRIEEQEIKS